MPVAQLDRALDSDTAGRRREIDNKILVPVAQLDRVSDSDSVGCRREIDNYILVPVAQLDRALDSDSKGQRFESSRARQNPLIRRLFRGFNFSSFFKTCDNATNP